VTETAESALLERLVESDRNGERITLVVGSGLDDQHMPRVSDVIAVAERFAAGRNDDGDLREALKQAREDCIDGSPGTRYEEYRRVLAGWLSADELDAIAPADGASAVPPAGLTRHGARQPRLLAASHG
jgi:hypothetical protein